MIRTTLATGPEADAGERMTVDAFLRWSEGRPDEERHELVDGRPVEMPSERNRHALVKADVWRSLDEAVLAADLPCTAFPDGVTVAVAEDRARLPDAVLQCEGEVDLDGLTCDAPLVIVEVASPSTARVDTTAKLAEYMGLGSVRHYLIVDPEARLAYHHSRTDASGDILTRIVTDGPIALDPPGVSIDLADVFATIDRLERPRP